MSIPSAEAPTGHPAPHAVIHLDFHTVCSRDCLPERSSAGVASPLRAWYYDDDDDETRFNPIEMTRKDRGSSLQNRRPVSRREASSESLFPLSFLRVIFLAQAVIQVLFGRACIHSCVSVRSMDGRKERGAHTHADAPTEGYAGT